MSDSIEYRIFLDDDDDSSDWIAIVTNKDDYKYLSGIGNTPVIALAELIFVIEFVEETQKKEIST